MFVRVESDKGEGSITVECSQYMLVPKDDGIEIHVDKEIVPFRLHRKDAWQRAVVLNNEGVLLESIDAPGEAKAA